MQRILIILLLSSCTSQPDDPRFTGTLYDIQKKAEAAAFSDCITAAFHNNAHLAYTMASITEYCHQVARHKVRPLG